MLLAVSLSPCLSYFLFALSLFNWQVEVKYKTGGEREGKGEEKTCMAGYRVFNAISRLMPSALWAGKQMTFIQAIPNFLPLKSFWCEQMKNLSSSCYPDQKQHCHAVEDKFKVSMISKCIFWGGVLRSSMCWSTPKCWLNSLLMDIDITNIFLFQENGAGMTYPGLQRFLSTQMLFWRRTYHLFMPHTTD